MAAVQNADADEPCVSIDLNTLFGDEQLQMEELDTIDIPDSDLVDLMESVTKNNAETVKN